MMSLMTPADVVRPVPLGFLAPAVQVRGVEMLFGTKAQSYPAKTAPNPDAQIAALTEVLGPVAHLRQTHSNRVVRVTSSGVWSEADALVTTARGVWLAIKTADCVPVLLATEGGVAAAHAGWRGLESGVLGNAVAALCEATGQDPLGVTAVIGPHISQPHYEVDGHFVEIFQGDFFVPSRAGKVKLDMTAVARAQLHAAGLPLANISAMGRCTFGEPAVFNSYRRTVQDGVPFANNLSMVRLVG